MSDWYDKAVKETEEKLLFDLTHYEEALKAAENSNFESAYQSSKTALEPRDAETQYNWGVFYYNGTGVEQNYEKAFKWFKLSADQDYTSALAALGYMYERGQFVDKDVAIAITYLKKAAKKGDRQASYVLGYLYYRGAEVDADYGKSFTYLADFEREVRDDDQTCYYDANCLLGMMYLLGQGLEANYLIAVKCLKRAADHDDEEAQYWLGVAYLAGCGVERDETLGVDWLTRSEKNGYKDAKVLLDSKENRTELLSNILQLNNQEETKTAKKVEEHNFFIYDTPYFGKTVLTFDLGLEKIEDNITENNGWAKLLFFKLFNTTYRELQTNEIVSFNSEITDYIIETDSIHIKENKLFIDLKDYLNDSIESFNNRFGSVVQKYSDIQNSLFNLFSENASFFSNKWSISQFMHQLFDDYIFLMEFEYDVEFLYVNERYAEIKTSLLSCLKDLIKTWKTSVGNNILNSGISDNLPHIFSVDFSSSASDAVRVLSDLKKQFENERYTSIIRQVPRFLIDKPEYIVLFEDKERNYGLGSYLFKPENVLQHISSAFDVKKTLAIDLNYLETISDDYLGMYEYIAELCEESKGIVFISNGLRPGKIASFIFESMRSPFRDNNRFQRDGVIVPLLTIELQFMKYGRSQFDKRPENEVDHLLITNTNISYMLPVITEAVKTLVKNAGCYEEGGTLKNRTRLCEEIRYNHSNVRIAELYE